MCGSTLHADFSHKYFFIHKNNGTNSSRVRFSVSTIVMLYKDMKAMFGFFGVETDFFEIVTRILQKQIRTISIHRRLKIPVDQMKWHGRMKKKGKKQMISRRNHSLSKCICCIVFNKLSKILIYMSSDETVFMCLKLRGTISSS